jgi:hypothetical protein
MRLELRLRWERPQANFLKKYFDVSVPSRTVVVYAMQ